MPSSCPERENLLEELKAANHDLNEIHKNEVTAAVNYDMASFNELQEQLVPARKRRDVAATELKRHIRQHRCS